MKRIIYFLALFVCICTLAPSCKKNDYRSDKEEPVNYFNQILKMGFDTAGIADFGEYYLVEEDVRLPKSLFKKTTIARQAIISSNVPVSLTNQTNITVKVDASVPTNGNYDWRAEVQQAIQEYNNVNSNLHFTYVTTTTADINIVWGNIYDPYGYIDYYALAEAEFPVNGEVGNQILIHRNFNAASHNYNIDNITSLQKKYNIIHEIGHCIGFRHTNWRNQEAQSGWLNGIYIDAIQVGNSPNGVDPDPSSVFNGRTAKNSWSSFSTWDLYAIRYLYPAPVTYYNVSKSEIFIKNDCDSGYVGSPATYTVPAGTYSSTISQADADQQAQNAVNTNGQTYANANGTCLSINYLTVTVIVTNPNPSGGYMPSVNFFDPLTGQNIAYKTFYSSYNSMNVPPGNYNLHITQTNYKPFTVSISGYPTKTGSTVIYNNVPVQSSFPTITIGNR